MPPEPRIAMRAVEADEKIKSMIVFSSSSRPKKIWGRVGRGKEWAAFECWSRCRLSICVVVASGGREPRDLRRTGRIEVMVVVMEAGPVVEVTKKNKDNKAEPRAVQS